MLEPATMLRGAVSQDVELHEDVELTPYRAWIGSGDKDINAVTYLASYSADDDSSRVVPSGPASSHR